MNSNNDPTSNSPQGAPVFGELVELTYATVAEPEKFHDLVDLWEKCLTEHAATQEKGPFDSAMTSHFNSALQIFDHIGRVQKDHDRAKKMLEFFSVPALISDASMNLLLANTRFQEWMGETRSCELLMDGAIADQIAGWSDGQSIAFASQQGDEHGTEAAVITELPIAFQDNMGNGRFFLIVFNEITTDDEVWDTIRQKHSLTSAETEVLVQLAQGYRADDIARIRDVSINTVRVHVRALLEKTGCRNQNDLIRSSVFLFNQFQSLKLISQAMKPAGHEQEAQTSRVILPSGRMMHFMQFGDPQGLPVLYLHGMMAGPDLPEHIKASAIRNNLRILAPSRPGFGKSDTIPATGMELVR